MKFLKNSTVVHFFEALENTKKSATAAWVG